MRLNKFLAQNTSLSRRSADIAIEVGRVKVNSHKGHLGQVISITDSILLDGKKIQPLNVFTIIAMHKPKGYVCSKNGQGSKTIYDLLPGQYKTLKSVGRLDKDTTGLLLLTNDGELANELTHPRNKKQKVYDVMLDKSLIDKDAQKMLQGVILGDGLSKFDSLKKVSDGKYRVVLSEGRKRQIRRTFFFLSYKVISLHRIQFGPYSLNNLAEGKYKVV